MRILVTGSTGLLGKYLTEIMPNAIGVRSKEFDLTSQREASLLIEQEKPDWVIHLAAKVGGILDNRDFPCDYYEENMLMNTNILTACRKFGVKRFTGILSTCAYPDVSDHYPLKEEDLHDGPPNAHNFGYGISKRALATHIDACNSQYGTKYNYIIPCNLYGFYDNFSPEKGHYVAALIKKIYEVKDSDDMYPLFKNKNIELFGTGRPLRQFMYAGDLAQVIKEMTEKDMTESFNVATPETFSIRRIAEIAMKSIGKKFEINFNDTYPDGQYRKDVSIEKFNNLFPDFKFTPLSEGINKTYEYYCLIKNQ